MSDEMQMVEESFEPDKQYMVTNLETLKVVSDPTRLRVLELLVERSRTVKELSKLLDLAPTKLYYHINLLEQHELIRVVGTRVVSGIIEKQYRTRAHSIELDRSLLALGTDNRGAAIDKMLQAIFDATREDVRDALKHNLMDLTEEDPKKRTGLTFRLIAKLTPEQSASFQEKLLALVKEYSDLNDYTQDDLPEDCKPYGLTVAFYPFAKNRNEEA
jgi:DNA-binding transcriptional ArsR family regulator